MTQRYPPLVQDLLLPQAYSEAPASVTLGETHISYLFFTGSRVYKVKKPVDFGFLDFTTLEKRRHFCHQEVALNRRLSPDVYLEVAEVREEGGRHHIGGPGRTVEYAVVMRQLPAHRFLDHLLRQGQVTTDMVKAVAEKIARFHREAATGPEITRLGGLEAVRYNVDENFLQTRAFIGRTLALETWQSCKAYAEAFLEVREGLLRRREAQGRVRDCHGDLHTAQVCMEDSIQIIDCIEFNERFRYSDVANDLAFLAMDLDHHGRPDLSGVLVEGYIAATSDQELPSLLDFFKAYRAYVRGKVTSFRLAEPLEEKEATAVSELASRYFELARSYGALTQPALLLACGLMGTGKSTLAKDLAARIGAPVISSDVVRKELAGIPASQHRYVGWGEGIYSPEFSRRTYREMHRLAAQALAEGRRVVLDATYQERGHRQQAARLAQEAGASLWVLECRLPLSIIRRRLEERETQAGASDGRLELLDQQVQAFESVTEIPEVMHVVIDTGDSREEVAFGALKELYRRYLAQEQG